MLAVIFISCSGDDEKKQTQPVAVEHPFIRAADISTLPELESTGTLLYNGQVAEDMLVTLKNSGCNTVRIRLWKDPASAHSSMSEVQALAARAKAKGFKIWLTVHYSDHWADPGNQQTPADWQNMSVSELKNAVRSYTEQIISEISPDIFQIGNETNDGMLWPSGRLSENPTQYLELVRAATETIRSKAPDTRIMLHYAGLNGADWYFDKVKTVDYDYIGLSYYPVWHGKSLPALKTTMDALYATHGKKVVVAETAYPFTLQWADWTNNIVGLPEQLLPGFDATPVGQKSFLQAVKSSIKQSQGGIGFCYWGGEWVAFRGSEATNGSTWENQALYDFDHKALPVMDVFKND
jgi:arabinogalactan endo-1,4-beta-galactosidase